VSLGYLSLVLHAHLPFVRHADRPGVHRDDWFLEALVECYVPLLQSWHRLIKDDVPFRLTLSVSPTLLSMFMDPFLKRRAREHLDGLVELGDKELVRTAQCADLHAVAGMYRERFSAAREFFIGEWQADAVACIEPIVEEGRIELITTAATHGFLPGLKMNPNAVRGQIMVALDLYERVFGGRPEGFWLPECGYYPEVERELEREGIRYFFVDAQAIANARPHAKYGVHAPVYTRAGVAAFARDPEASEQVWSSLIGYPGDHDYREYYRDIGYELGLDYVGPYLPRDGVRKDTGYKYWRVTGPGENKEVYVRESALGKAGLHSRHFLQKNIDRACELSQWMQRKPIFVAPFDAELFGHWWFEGPEWLEYLMRQTVFDQEAVELATPSDYLDEYPTNQVVELSPSTWGRDSDSTVWVSGRNDYIYRHLRWAAEKIKQLANERAPDNTIRRRAKAQAARELLLAQSSDWPFMMADENTAEYGQRRFREHMLNFLGLYRQIQAGHYDEQWLSRLEAKDNLFPHIDSRYFA